MMNKYWVYAIDSKKPAGQYEEAVNRYLTRYQRQPLFVCVNPDTDVPDSDIKIIREENIQRGLLYFPAHDGAVKL